MDDLKADMWVDVDAMVADAMVVDEAVVDRAMLIGK